MLRARAQRVVPGGMWGHLNAARLPEGYPQYFASAEGCRVRDVDGREYIDFMCSWGPVLLGHSHPEVQAAAEAQAALGDCSTARARSGGAGRRFRRDGAACRLGDVPEERRRRHHRLRDDRAGRDRAGARCWSRRAAITARCHGARRASPASPARTARICCTLNTTTWRACRRRSPKRARILPRSSCRPSGMISPAISNCRRGNSPPLHAPRATRAMPR